MDTTSRTDAHRLVVSEDVVRDTLGLQGWTITFGDLDGLRGICDWDGQTITIAAGLDAPNTRATLLHEAYHAHRGPFPAILEGREERTVRKLVARDLVPLSTLARIWDDGLTPAEVAAEALIPEHVILTRLEHLTDDEVADLYTWAEAAI